MTPTDTIENKSIGKRTSVDFSKHEVIYSETEGTKVWHIKKPNTGWDSVKFINTNGVLVVTGDYSNWIFCREFHPSIDGFVSEQYWMEKARISSCQELAEYDSNRTEEAINNILAQEDDNLTDEERQYLELIRTCTDDELEYKYRAYREKVGRFDYDYECIPYVKTVRFQLLAVFDAFDEMCRRIKEEK